MTFVFRPKAIWNLNIIEIKCHCLFSSNNNTLNCLFKSIQTQTKMICVWTELTFEYGKIVFWSAFKFSDKGKGCACVRRFGNYECAVNMSYYSTKRIVQKPTTTPRHTFPLPCLHSHTNFNRNNNKTHTRFQHKFTLDLAPYLLRPFEECVNWLVLIVWLG